MRDVRGYRAYQRLKRGWRLLSVALFGIALSPLLQGITLAGVGSVGYLLMTVSLAVALTGSIFASSGFFGGLFRLNCLFLAGNCSVLLINQQVGTGGGFAWLTLILGLFAADRWLRREMGLARGMTLFPPGCMLGLLVLPFFWPVAMVLGTVFLFLYLVGAYLYLAGALPRPEELVRQLGDPTDHAMDALTRI